ncbi:hypothetical protein GCM10017717_20830 [Deinococcus persicinus]
MSIEIIKLAPTLLHVFKAGELIPKKKSALFMDKLHQTQMVSLPCMLQTMH